MQGFVDAFAIAGAVSQRMQGVEAGTGRQYKTLVLEHFLDQLRVVTILLFVVVVMVLPDIGHVLQKQHGQDKVLVNAGVHRATESVARGPD